MSVTPNAAADRGRAAFARVASGDAGGLAELAALEGGWLRALALGITGRLDVAEDVVQQLWLTVAAKAGACRDAARYRAWLWQICRRIALDAAAVERRSQRLAAGSEVDAGDGVGGKKAEGGGGARHSAELRERSERVLAAVRGLPLIYREPLVLRALHGWDCQTVADVLGIGLPTLETRLVRARRLLRELLEEDSKG